jgi:hypothetical protein
VLHEDASKYEITADQCLFYMYNPFRDEVMRRVIENIADSVRRHPRKVLVIYLNPLCRKGIESHPAYEKVHEQLFHRSRFVVCGVRLPA